MNYDISRLADWKLSNKLLRKSAIAFFLCVVIARHITQAALQLRLRRNVAGRVVGVGDTVPLRITDRFQPRFPIPLRIILLVY